MLTILIMFTFPQESRLALQLHILMQRKIFCVYWLVMTVWEFVRHLLKMSVILQFQKKMLYICAYKTL